MARKTISTNAWEEVITTAQPTQLSVEGGPVRVYTDDVTGVSTTDGFVMQDGQRELIPTGVTVNVVAVNKPADVVTTPFGS